MRPELRLERKNRLLGIAAVVFSEKGYAGTTISAVAARAGIGKGTVYGYFASKEELFFELFFWYGREMMAGVSLAPPPPDQAVRDTFLAIVAEIVQRMQKAVHMYPLTLEFWSATASGSQRNRFRQAMEAMYTQYREWIGSLISEGIRRNEFDPDTDVAAISAGILGTIDALGLQYWMNPDFDVETTAHQIVSAILNGISRPPEGGEKG